MNHIRAAWGWISAPFHFDHTTDPDVAYFNELTHASGKRAAAVRDDRMRIERHGNEVLQIFDGTHPDQVRRRES